MQPQLPQLRFESSVVYLHLYEWPQLDISMVRSWTHPVRAVAILTCAAMALQRPICLRVVGITHWQRPRHHVACPSSHNKGRSLVGIAVTCEAFSWDVPWMPSLSTRDATFAGVGANRGCACLVDAQPTCVEIVASCPPLLASMGVPLGALVGARALRWPPSPKTRRSDSFILLWLCCLRAQRQA